MDTHKTTSRREWEREQRLERLVDIAQGLFFKKGFEYTTMEDIAKTAGYNKRTLYLYFKDKDELLLAVVLRGQRIFIDHLNRSFVQHREEGSLIRELGHAFFSFSIEYPDFFRLIIQYESISSAYYESRKENNDSQYKDLCREASDEYGEIITEAITIGINNGKIKTKLDPKQLMLILWGEAFGVMQIILMRKEHFAEAYKISPKELYDEFIAITSRALSE